jgi:hypothetical protein
VDDYFNHQLNQGLTVPKVIETFKDPLLPYGLKTEQLKNFTESQILRCAQLISSRRIIKYNQEKNAEMLL